MKKLIIITVLLILCISFAGNLAWAVDESTEPTQSEPVITNLPPVPTAPTGLIATNVTQTSISISWHSNPADEAVDSYNIYKDGIFQTNTLETKYTASNLEPGKTYKFYVSAQNISGEGPASEVLTVSTSSPYAPPINLRATNIGATSITIAWDGNAPSYEIYVNGEVNGTTTYTSYTITDLQPEQPYEIYVVAVYDESNSISSEPGVYETGDFSSEPSNLLSVTSGAEPVPASVEGIVGASFPYIKMLVPFLIMAFAIGATFLILENLPVIFGRRRY